MIKNGRLAQPPISLLTLLLILIFILADSNETESDITNVTCGPDGLLVEKEADDSIFKTIFTKKALYLMNALVFLFLFTFVNPTRFRKINAIGSLCNFGLIGIVMYFAFSWGLNVDFSDPDATLYMPMFRLKLYRLTGVLSMGLFLHNAVITIVCKTRNQKNNVRIVH